VVLAANSPLDWPAQDFEQITQNINVRVVLAQSSLAAATRCTDLLNASHLTSAVRQLAPGDAIVGVLRPLPRLQQIQVFHATPIPQSD
jgi:hypothetical protein